jgi:hypothetical protein
MKKFSGMNYFSGSMKFINVDEAIPKMKDDDQSDI